jgi:hypothetical protein
VLPLLNPSRDQGLVSTGQPAQFRDGPRPELILGALAIRRAELEPGHLSQQVSATVGNLSQLSRSRGFGVVVQAAPPGIAQGDAIQPGDGQPVSGGSGTILSHLASIERPDDKCNLTSPFRSHMTWKVADRYHRCYR